MDFFKNDKPELVMELLKQATKASHIRALYMIDIISVFLGGESRREEYWLAAWKKWSELKK